MSKVFTSKPITIEDGAAKELSALLGGVGDDYPTLRLFACRCIKEIYPVLSEEHGFHEDDLPRIRYAIELAESYARGDAPINEVLKMEDGIFWMFNTAQYQAMASDGADEDGVLINLPDTISHNILYAVLSVLQPIDDIADEVRYAQNAAFSVASCAGLMSKTLTQNFRASATDEQEALTSLAKFIEDAAVRGMLKWQIGVLKGMINARNTAF